jgi:hypothetical protein
MSFNLWDYKPWWCQPWSIVLTGMGIISGSWWLLNNIFITVILSIVIFIWWFYFLFLYPRLIEKMLKTDSNSIKKLAQD